jgi:hypothetical protein
MKWSVGGQSYPFMIVMSIFGLRIKKPYPREKYSPAVAKISKIVIRVLYLFLDLLFVDRVRLKLCCNFPKKNFATTLSPSLIDQKTWTVCVQLGFYCHPFIYCAFFVSFLFFSSYTVLGPAYFFPESLFSTVTLC